MSMVSSSAIISWNEGKRILGDLDDSKEQLHTSFESECPRREKSLPLARHFHVLLLCETIDQHVLWVCPCRWAQMVQLQFWWFPCFYLNWRMLCASVVWEYFIINGHNFRISDHQFANEADFLNFCSKVEHKGHKEVVFKCLVEVKC